MQAYFDKRQVIQSYPFILCTCVKESGKKANHMRNILRLATIVTRGKRDIQYISFR